MSILPPSRSTPGQVGSEALNRAITESDVRAGEVVLAYLPVINVSVGKPLYFEALARIILPDGRVIAAGAFHESIRQTDLGRELDIRVLSRLRYDLEEIPWLRASINVPINSIANRRWVSAFDAMVGNEPKPHQRVLVEIDETSASTLPDLASDFMSEYQSRGIMFAMDNFGSDRTSLKNLVSFHFDFIKVDQYFVRNIHENADKMVIAKAITAIANELDAFCIAEKVETASEAACLKEIGFSLMQGYFFGEPLYGSTLKHAHPAFL